MESVKGMIVQQNVLSVYDQIDSLSRIIQNLDNIIEVQASNSDSLTGFESTIIHSLRKEKQFKIKELNEAYETKLNFLISICYYKSVDISIVNNDVVCNNSDENDTFRIFFFALLCNFCVDGKPNVQQNFSQMDYKSRKLYFEHGIPSISTPATLNKNQIKAKDVEYIVKSFIYKNIDISQKYKNNFIGFCKYLVEQLKDPIIDLAIVAYSRILIFESKADNTPAFNQLLDISSEFYSKKNGEKQIYDKDEFWWKMSNATFSYIYITEEGLQPKKKGYPRIEDGEYQLPNIYFQRVGEVLRYRMDPQYQPMYTKVHQPKPRKFV